VRSTVARRIKIQMSAIVVLAVMLFGAATRAVF
jgi:hypothetical protein